MDRTTDLARVAKIYGTRKPESNAISRFYGDERIEDHSLLEHLLSLPVEQNKGQKSLSKSGFPISTYDSLTDNFIQLMKAQPDIAELWDGSGKNSGDTSRSGYDMSLMHACVRNGITDVRELATILALRDNGGVRHNGKGDDYIRTTVMKALGNAKW